MQTTSRVFVIASMGIFVMLSACSHRPTGSGVDDPSAAVSAAQTYPLQQEPGYAGEVQKNQYGEVTNALSAPSSQTYYFEFDSNIVKSSDYDAVITQAEYLAAHPQAKVRLEGNTDNRGSREYNVGLGLRRDQSVERLLEQHGALASQIRVVSYGKERPNVLGNNERAWRLNRRVNLVYEVIG